LGGSELLFSPPISAQYVLAFFSEKCDLANKGGEFSDVPQKRGDRRRSDATGAETMIQQPPGDSPPRTLFRMPGDVA
jgi:hypothetical protein